MMEVAADVMAIVGPKSTPPRLSLERLDSLEELGISSLSLVELIFDLEEKFDIEIPYNANSTLPDINTVGDLVDAIQKLVAQKSAV